MFLVLFFFNDKNASLKRAVQTKCFESTCVVYLLQIAFKLKKKKKQVYISHHAFIAPSERIYV